MRRWHEERALMLRRWREEIALHEEALPKRVTVPPDAEPDACHCYRGMGFLRKHAPSGCGRARCGLCHWEKLYDRARRQRERSRALTHEWDATGGW